MFDYLSCIISTIIDQLSVLSQELDSSFLSDVAALEGVLLAVSLPISLDLVSRISGRYKSQEITKIFAKENLYKSLKILLPINIIIAIVLQFYKIESPSCLYIVMSFLIVSLIIFMFFIKLVESYSTSSDKLFLGRFNSDLNKILKRKK